MTQYVFGKNSILSVLNHQPDRIYKILVAEGNRPDRRMTELLDLAKGRNIRVDKLPRNKLDALKPDPDIAHQGVIAVVSPKPLLTIDELIEQAKDPVKLVDSHTPLLFMLDGIEDPRNFGAILRVADACGASGVVIPKRNSAGFGPAVSKTASGAEETVPVAMVSNLVQALEKLKQAGFWSAGASISGKSQLYDAIDWCMPTVLVLGSEGQGISRLLAEHCDYLVHIPMLGTVDSLNVSAATAVLAFEVRRQQRLRDTKPKFV